MTDFIALLQQLSPARGFRCRSIGLIARSRTDVQVRFDSLTTGHPLGEFTIMRTARWGYSQVAGKLPLDCWAVDIDDLRGGRPLNRREWHIAAHKTEQPGALVIPAFWNVFTFGPRLRLCILMQTGSLEIEIAGPKISGSETLGYFRLANAKRWITYCIASENDRRPMFDEVDPFFGAH